MNLLSMIVALAIIWTADCSIATCPNYCTCHGPENDTVVCCTGYFPSPFTPPDLPNYTVSADFSRCRLQQFPKSVVAKLLIIQSLHLAILQSPELHKWDLPTNLTSLRVLNMSYGSLNRIDIHLDMHFPRLQSLYLRGNNFHAIPKIQNNQKNINLKYIDLRDNKFTSLTSSDRSSIHYLTEYFPSVEIDLDGNPFDCRCSLETFEFVKWIQKGKRNLRNQENMKCKVNANYDLISDMKFRSLLLYNWECFQNSIPFMGLIAGFSVLLIPFTVLICLSRYCWKRIKYPLKYQCYRLKRKLNCSTPQPTSVSSLPPPGISGYIHISRNTNNCPKVYVIYDDNDEFVRRFVDSELRSVIGSRFYMLTDAHLGPGAPKAASINTAVSVSACSLVVLSSGIFENADAMWGVTNSIGKSSHHPLFIIYSAAIITSSIKWTEGLASKEGQLVYRSIRAGRCVGWGTEDAIQTRCAKEKIKSHLRRHSNVREIGDEPANNRASCATDSGAAIDADELGQGYTEQRQDYPIDASRMNEPEDSNFAGTSFRRTDSERLRRTEQVRLELLQMSSSQESQKEAKEENTYL